MAETVSRASSVCEDLRYGPREVSLLRVLLLLQAGTEQCIVDGKEISLYSGLCTSLSTSEAQLFEFSFSYLRSDSHDAPFS